MGDRTSGPDFQVVRIEPDEFVVGRNCGDDIPVGMIFTVAAKVRLDGDALHLSTVELGTVASIRLVLTAVQLYRRSIDLIPSGHTAGLRLDGEGFGQLREAVRTALPHEYIHLRG